MRASLTSGSSLGIAKGIANPTAGRWSRSEETLSASPTHQLAKPSAVSRSRRTSLTSAIEESGPTVVAWNEQGGKAAVSEPVGTSCILTSCLDVTSTLTGVVI